MKTLLIATTNEGKYKELLHVLDTQPFHILSLKDLETPLIDPEETEPTLDGNAMLKATYYGEKTGYMTLADDTGLFIHSLAGWPGVKSARIANDSKERREAVLEKLQGKKDAERDATFHTTLALYDPDTKSMFLARGDANGRILEEEPSEIHHNFGYDPIFFVTEAGKTFDQMTNEEKNAMSHRGKAISQIKYYLSNQYGGKHIIVPCAITIKDGKILLARRNDPHNSEFHGKWEFSGGSMNIGETLEENLKREIYEECGYDVQIEKRLHAIGIFPFHHAKGRYSYQVYLIPHICTIVSGNGEFHKEEVMEMRWVSPDEILSYDLIPENKILYQNFSKELDEWIKNNHNT